MIFGLLKDIKVGESRVVATPAEISEIVTDGHEVFVASGAGVLSGFEDEDYEKSGATILATNEEIWAKCDFVAKVKEIEKSEYEFMRENQIIYCCIHPAAHKEEVDALLEKKVIAFTAEDSHRYGSPNCEAAGKTGAFMGMWSLSTFNGGKGVFPNGLAGAPGAKAVVCGSGKVGSAAIETLVNMGVQVTVLDSDLSKLNEVNSMYHGRVATMTANKYNLSKLLPTVDILINSVRWPKDATEPMVTREMVASMEKGSVIVDISNDYGCIETFRETTLDDPIYIEEGVVHYCVSNMPSAIAKTTSTAYAAAVLQHFKAILNKGVTQACIDNGFLRRSLTAYKGYLTHEETSGIQDRPWIQPEKILGIEDSNFEVVPKATFTRSNNFYDEI